MMPDVDVHDTETLALSGKTLRACHRVLVNQDAGELPLETNLETIDSRLQDATRTDGNRWGVTMTRMEWVTVYGCLYTTPEAKMTAYKREAMLSLLNTFPDELTRLAEHTRDFYDAVSEVQE